MTGLLLCFWCASTFTAGHLLWAAGLTGYILLGTLLEERDLVARFGAAYRAYAARVPAFFPSPRKMPTRCRAMNQTEPVEPTTVSKHLEHHRRHHRQRVLRPRHGDPVAQTGP